MKILKIISIILCIISVFCMASCGNIGNPASNTSSTSDTTVANATSGTKKPVYSTSPNHSSDISGSVASGYYESFEDVLVRAPHIIVKANLISVNSYGNDRTKFTFKVNEILMGELGETVDVIVSNKNHFIPAPNTSGIYFSNSGIKRDYETEYLLLLSRDGTVYSNVYPLYVWIRGLIINLDNIPLSEMYNQPLANHATGIDINICTKEELIDYVCELADGNKPATEISKAETLEEMIDDADCVFHVKVNKLKIKAESSLGNNETWICEVVDIIKGKAPINMDHIWVVFFEDTVKSGDEYIIALDGEGIVYTFVTKDSLRPVSEKAEIKGYIN